MPRGVYPRKKRYRAKVARQKIATEHMSRKGHSIDMAEDISQSVQRAHNLIQDGRRMVNQGWDLINSIPKRK